VCFGDLFNGEGPMGKTKKPRDQVLRELRSAYEGGASIRKLVGSTGRSYGSIHSMLRESGTTMRSRGGPNHRTRTA
jgi:hypothetical protein